MTAAADDAVAAAAADGQLTPQFGVDATRVARGPGGCLYRVDPPPEVRLLEDAPVDLLTGSTRVGGWLGAVADESCLVETDRDLGPRVLDGRLVVDNTGPLRGLRARLEALSGTPTPPTFRFDQAELVLGAPGGRLRDRIATAAESADAWSLDDRPGEVLSAALRHRWAAVQSPPGTDTTGLVPRLLDRLLQFEASVLFVAPAALAVDRTVGALCERLAGAGRLRSGVVQRVGPLAPGGVRDRWGPYVEAATIAADLRAGLDERLAALDGVDGRLRYDDPDTLVIQQHTLRVQRRAARQAADRLALELASIAGPVPSVEEVLGEGARTPDQRRRQVLDARDELGAARDGIVGTLRRRCRLVATTTRSAYQRELPRTEFDVVVIAGPASPPEAYW
ncbi:MAG TPA: AAA domain-containing protein, partial [Mycobacteriales bacterium]|nr:AAA domain-containing protein [Mycobacteriales bacterium]